MGFSLVGDFAWSCILRSVFLKVRVIYKVSSAAQEYLARRSDNKQLALPILLPLLCVRAFGCGCFTKAMCLNVRPITAGGDMARTRNRRLRKKLHLGEFVEKGFEITFNLNPEVSEMDFHGSLTEVLYPSRMAYSCEDAGRMFIFRPFCTLEDKDRTLVAAWLMKQDYLVSTNVGDLVSAWHPPRGLEEIRRGARLRRMIKASRWAMRLWVAESADAS